ncbi:hypothetical protein Sjap_011682 [Stephania japonica]|uniref:Pentatricopeptide repeat-containing protein n=1 Tax=Stephania japonica TaxID=461633 RepID=A0AAP0JCU6_9MAGN
MVRTIAAASAARRYGNLEMIINFFCLSITATYEHQPFAIIGQSRSNRPISKKSIVHLFEHILRRCSTIQQAKETHTQIVITRSDQYAYLAARLIVVYAQFGCLADAKMAFQGIPVEHKSNLLLWNSMLRANQSYGYFAESLRLYLQMRTLGIMPDEFTFPLVVRTCASMGNWDMCKLVHVHVLVSGFQFRVHVANELIGMFGKLGYMDHARKVFDRMQFRSCISWNSLIYGFSKNYDLEGTINTFKWMELEGMEPNLVAWTSLLSAHARCGKCEDVLRLFCEMRLKRNGQSPILRFSSKGRGNECLDMFRRMLYANVDPNSVTFAGVLSACGELAVLDRGIEIHGHSIRACLDNNILVGNGLINMYVKCGKLKEAQIIFDKLGDRDLVSWNSMIAGYGMHGFGEDGLLTFRQMVEVGQRPDEVTFVAVLSACSHAGLVTEGRQLFDQIVNVCSQFNL